MDNTAEQFLVEWIDEHVVPNAYPGSHRDVEHYVHGCIADAEAVGIAEAQLRAAAPNGLESMFFDAAVAAADAEVKRLASDPRA